METIGAFGAKTHMAALLDRMARGEKITIARYGIAAAVLAPIAGNRDGTKAFRIRCRPFWNSQSVEALPWIRIDPVIALRAG
jgi:antitoxin (DNA-binding transcriptional repressor) of toxin-antitoxin stability system